MTESLMQTELCDAYRAEASHYAQALKLAELLAPAVQRGEDPEHLVHQLAASLVQVASIETRISQAKQQWGHAGAKPGPELAAVLSQVGSLIQSLRETLAKVEAEARRQQAHLAPELDHLIRRQHMRRAYGEAATAGD